jgi:hypothetical protein
MSRPLRRLSRAALAVAAVLSVCLPVRAQSVGQYLALAREYADGRGADADASLARWTKDDVTVAVTAALTTARVRDLLAAAMLHTDLANTIVETQPFDAEFHLTKARRNRGADLIRPLHLGPVEWRRRSMTRSCPEPE